MNFAKIEIKNDKTIRCELLNLHHRSLLLLLLIKLIYKTISFMILKAEVTFKSVHNNFMNKLICQVNRASGLSLKKIKYNKNRVIYYDNGPSKVNYTFNINRWVIFQLGIWLISVEQLKSTIFFSFIFFFFTWISL